MIQQARDKFMTTCLGASGFEYHAEPWSEPVAPFDGLYPSEELLAKYGYGFAFEATRAAFAEQGQATGSSVPSAAFESSADSCGTQFNDAVGMQKWFALQLRVDELANSIKDRVYADDRYLSTRSAWSSCMSAQGYNVSTSSEAADLSDREESGPPYKIAVVDYRCRKDVQYNETVLSLESEYLSAWTAEHPTDVTEIRTTNDEIARRAVELSD